MPFHKDVYRCLPVTCRGVTSHRGVRRSAGRSAAGSSKRRGRRRRHDSRISEGVSRLTERGAERVPAYLESVPAEAHFTAGAGNSPRLGGLIHDGKLELSLSDALALTLENNLDIVVQRYVIPFAQTDLLRSKSGQAARGFTGALYPSELNSGAIGAGVTSAGATGGTGNAGGITGGGGAVSIGAAGAFDPSVSFSTSFDRVTSPLNSLVVSGIPTTTSDALAYSASYAQLFTTGLSYSVSLSTLRQITTQENVLYNPDVTSRLSVRRQPAAAGGIRAHGK